MPHTENNDSAWWWWWLQQLVPLRHPKIAITSKSVSVLATLKTALLKPWIAAFHPLQCIWLATQHPPNDTLQWLQQTTPLPTLIIDLFTDPLGVLSPQHHLNSDILVSTIHNLEENWIRWKQPIASPTLVVIENYNMLVKHKGWHWLQQLINLFATTPQEEQRSVAFVILGYPEDDEHVLHRLVHLMLSGNQWDMVDDAIRCNVVSVRHLISGNIQKEYFQLTAPKIEPRSNKTDIKTYLEKIDSSEMTTTKTKETNDMSRMFGDLPFKLSLSEAERDKRAQVELPYVHNDVSLADTALEEHPKGLLLPSSDEDPEQDDDEDLDV